MNTHHRNEEQRSTAHRRAWYKSPLFISITSFAALCAAVGVILVTLSRAQDYAYSNVLEPRVRCTAAAVVSDSAKHIQVQLEAIKKRVDISDSNTLIVKSILEVMATPDQLVKATNRRNNTTGIR
jgi:hypothetical protein